MFKKSKIFILMLVILTILFSLSGIAASESITIKLAHGDTATDQWYSAHTGSLTFKRLVEARSNGEIQVEIYPAGQLGGEREMYESMKMGTTQMSWCSLAPLSAWVPEVQVTSIPYLYNSTEVAYKVLDGSFGKELNKLTIDKAGVRLLGFSSIGFRHFTSNEKPIKSPEDLEGQKIRMRESPAEIKLAESLGASATPISWGELYTALQQGVVDGEENPISMILDAKLYEVQKYITLDGHVFGVNPISINEKFYQSLPSDLKFIVADSAKKAALAYRGLIEYGSADGLRLLKEEGMEIYTLTEEEKEKFVNAAQGPVKEYIVEQAGEEIVDKLFDAIDEARQEYNEEIGI